MSLNEPEYENSAGRLLALLTSIPNGRSLLDEVPKLLEVKPSSEQHKQQMALRYLMDMHHLYLEFQQDMIDAEINEQQRGVLLAGLSGVQSSLYPVQLNAGYRAINDAEISLLKVCATFIDQEGRISDDDVTLIRDSIDQLRKQVEEGNISNTLRKALLELIRLSEDAISRHKIYGARGLKKTFKLMLADAAELYGVTGNQDHQEELIKSNTWKLIVKHLKLLDSVASKLLKYKPLLSGASKFLLPDS